MRTLKRLTINRSRSIPASGWTGTKKAIKPFVAAAAAAAFFVSSVAVAQQRGPRIIRDAEIEALLRDYSAPIFKAAGIGSQGAEIIIVNDRAFNAFVVSGHRMFINTGTLLIADTPNEVIGVIAHETGHLAGGHLQNLRNEVARAQAIGAIAAILGAGAMAAGVSAGSDTGARAGGAIAHAGPQLAMRTLLNYRRGQETAADRAAITYLNATGQSAQGMIKTFRLFADQALFAQKYVDPYVLSHPMPNDRIAQLETLAKQSKYWDKRDPESLQLRHDMMRAKLSGFIESPSRVDRRFPRSDKSLPAEYARAIVAYRSGGFRGARRQIDSLIRKAPNNPYFYELQGQAMLESGNAKAAVAPLTKAVSLARDAGLIRILLAHAQLESGNKALLPEAVANLKKGLTEEPGAAVGYRHLATAYARQGDVAQAELATAQGHLIDGNLKTAANLVPWQMVAKRTGAELGHVAITDDGRLDMDDFAAKIGPKVKVVAVTGMSNVLGTMPDIPTIAAAAHDHGARVVVDAAQLVPHSPVDVQALGADFLAFSSHKMLGPTGIGVLWGRMDALEEMEPFEGGGEMIADVTLHDSTWATIPHRFEAGTPPIIEAVGLHAAIDYLDSIGMDKIFAHDQELTGIALQRLGDVPGVSIQGPLDLDKRGGAVSMTMDGVHAHDLATILDEQDVAVRAGHHCAKPLMRRLGVTATARASFYLYNEESDIDALVAGLRRAGELFGVD